MSLRDYIEGINQMLENAKQEASEDEISYQNHSFSKTY